MQARDLLPQIQAMSLSEQLALLSALVRLIQQEIVPAVTDQPLTDNSHPHAPSRMGIAHLPETTTTGNSGTETEPRGEAVVTVLERMGGLPQHLLSVGNLSDRDIRRSIVAERIRTRYGTKP
jgi:hypothetical protein